MSTSPTPAPAVWSVDAHAHLDKYDDGDLTSIVDGIEAGRILTISVSVDPASYVRSQQIAERCRLVIPTFGIQPWEAPRFARTVDRVGGCCASSPMIGEIGLDHTFVSESARHGEQRVVFATLLDIAAEQRKVVNVHSTGAERDVAAMLRARRLDRVIMHWYAGDLETLDALIEEGYLFTVGAAVLHSTHIREVAVRVPDGQLLTETDNPGGERWHTGQSGHPRLLRRIESELAQLRGTTVGLLRAGVRANLARFLRDDPHLAPWSDLIAALDVDEFG